MVKSGLRGTKIYQQGGSLMQFYTKQHKFYCGIDLHTKKMYACILDEKGEGAPEYEGGSRYLSEGHCPLPGGYRGGGRMHVHLVLVS
jgi:hypothetical protein